MIDLTLILALLFGFDAGPPSVAPSGAARGPAAVEPAPSTPGLRPWITPEGAAGSSGLRPHISPGGAAGTTGLRPSIGPGGAALDDCEIDCTELRPNIGTGG
jgi:hypothetical protein